MHRLRHLQFAIAAGVLAVAVAVGALAFILSRSVTDELVAPGPERVPLEGMVGQSFVARHAGLHTVSVFVSTNELQSDLPLIVRVHESALLNTVLREAHQTVPVGATPGWVEFRFAPLDDSHNRMYYVTVQQGQPSGIIAALSVAPVTAYADGALYRDGLAQQAQLSLRIGFDSGAIAVDLIGWLADSVRQLVTLSAVLVLPGLALQTHLLPLQSLRARVALGAALSVCLYPVLFLGSRAIDWHAGPLLVWVPMILASVALIRHVPRPKDLAAAIHYLTLPRAIWLGLALLIIGTRWFLLRRLDAPMLGDSVQHTVMAQLLLDNGGLFSSWEPYAPYDTLTTHFGFHAAVAAVSWVTGESVFQSTLQTGQFLNVCAVVTLTLLAGWMVRSEWAGVGVLLFSGLLSPTPSIYVNWGRYAQLAGQVVMPVAVWWLFNSVSLEGRETPDHTWTRVGRIVIGTLLLVGTALNYYRMPHYIALAGAGLLLLWSMRYLRFSKLRTLLQAQAIDIALCGMASLILIAPWLDNLRAGNLVVGLGTSVTSGGNLDQVLSEYAGFIHIDEFVPGWLLATVCLVAVLALANRRARPLALTAWAIGIFLLPASRLLRVPGATQLQVFAIMISLYIPIGLIAGSGLDTLLNGLQSRSTRNRLFGAMIMMAIALVTVLALAGALTRAQIYEPRYRILAPADERAMEFIRQYTPQDAKILVNGFLVYDGLSAVGSDGGWYIPLLTHRKNTMPPQYALLAEHPSDPAYNRQVVEIVAELEAHDVTSPEGIALLCRTQITHVYIGQDQGQSGNPAPSQPLLSLSALESSSRFRLLYRQDRVALFAFDRSGCIEPQ